MVMDLTSEKGSYALQIVQKLTAAGHIALFAGGCVRDCLLGTIPTDYDIATSATPDQVEKLFPKTVPVGKQFGVILVILGNTEFEVATFRTEGGYQDGRRPGFIHFSNAEEDARRRDFTVNGLFYDPLKQNVLDYVMGQRDIQRKTIRCIGKPSERFAEDKLRLLRAIRFAVKLDFAIEAATWEELCIRASQISIVSKERIREELDKILLSEQASKGLELLVASGLWQVLWPQVAPAVIQRFKMLKERKISSACAVIYYGQKKSDVAEAMRDLRYSNDVIQKTTRILEIVHSLPSFSDLRPGNMKLLAADPLFEAALDVFSTDPVNLPTLSFIRQKTESWAGSQLNPPPFLNGEDLKSLGISPGPQVGKILSEAYLLQLEGKIENKSHALDWAKTQI